MKTLKAIWQAILNALKSTPKVGQPKVDAPKPVEPSTPTPVITNPKKLLTRDEYVAINKAIFEGVLNIQPYTTYPYHLLRETNGNNRSKGIDALIKRQGGSLGDAYCQFGQQDKFDAVAQHLGMSRKLFAYPEGGGTQRVFESVDTKYKTTTPKPGCFWTVEYNNSGKGHIEDIFNILPNGEVMTLAFNTSIDGDDTLVRDGAGAGIATRKFFTEKKQGSDVVRLRGYVDHYLIYVDAYRKHYNVK